MDITLPFPPDAEHAAAHAAQLVEMVQRIDGVSLDYSAESLETVDRLLGRFHDAGDDPDRMPETCFYFGCYVGEVMVRHADGRWIDLERDHFLYTGWATVDLGGGTICNPVGKVFKRVGNGSGDGIPYFYLVFTSRSSRR